MIIDACMGWKCFLKQDSFLAPINVYALRITNEYSNEKYKNILVPFPYLTDKVLWTDRRGSNQTTWRQIYITKCNRSDRDERHHQKRNGDDQKRENRKLRKEPCRRRG